MRNGLGKVLIGAIVADLIAPSADTDRGCTTLRRWRRAPASPTALGTLCAECGSAFFADLVAHKEVRETYLNSAAAADLRGRVGEEVSFGGITFRRCRGGLGFGVPTDKAYFYPEGVEGLFEIYYAPADTFETVNTLGLPLYARMIPDRDRDEWVRLEIESNPLPICTRPQVLRSAKRT